MRKVLKEDFFDQPTITVAPKLLGKYLVRKIGRKIIALKITEVEAYDGPRDRASHGSRGKTMRNQVMFGPAGHFYVYFVYGMHWMLNIVTGETGYPAAVLIRSVDGITGPARLTKFLRIGKSFNGKIARPRSGLWFEDRGEKIPKLEIKKTARIGVSYAGPVWSKKPYRFFLQEKSLPKRRGVLNKLSADH